MNQLQHGRGYSAWGQSAWGQLLLIAVVVLLLWLPRGFGLDRYATADENAWLTRSANFYWALARGDWAETFQRHHPGVTLTWAGTIGFLATYPAYANETDRNFGWLAEELTPFLRAQGHEPLELLAAGRSVVVLWIVATLTLTFFFARRRWGLWPALVGIALVAFDPFQIAHARLMHLDGLLSSFMILAVVTLLVALDPEEDRGWQWGALVTAGIAAGLAWLTRSPGFFLIPFAGLMAAISWFQAYQAGQPTVRSIRFFVTQLFVWSLLGAATFFLLWPAMWVYPWGSLRAVLSAANEYATEGHADPIFFNGTVYNGDPGFWFYPLTWLWRVTPVGLIGALLGLGWLVLRRITHRLPTTPASSLSLSATPGLRVGQRSREGWREVSTDILILLLMALGFTLFMNLGAKKFDRYLLPVYPALDLVAGLGWVATGRWLQQRWPSARTTGSAGALLTLLVAGQAAFALPHYPYYLTYYNPLLGDGRVAPTVMQIGRGEGANLAAEWLNHQSPMTQSPNQAPTTVASTFPNGPFSYFYQGRTVPPTFWTLADYAVVYAQDFQRLMPSPRQIAWIDTLTPLHQIDLQGIAYARIYDLQGAPLPPFVTTWAEGEQPQIRLNAYELTAGAVQPGEAVRTTFYLENLAPIAEDLNVLVRLVGADGTELARSEGWPWGAPTSTWGRNEIWPDGHTLTIPTTAAPGLYRLALGFYAPETQAIIPATQVTTGQVTTDLLPLDFLQVGATVEGPAMPFAAPYQFGDWTGLIGYTTSTSTGRQIDIGRTPLVSGEALQLTLFWQVQRGTLTDYTAFVHIVDGTGAMLTQQDQPPTAGFLPTTLWRKGQVVADRYILTIPSGAALGTYQIHVGLYDPATMARLPVQQAGSSSGDSVPLTKLLIALSR